MSALTDLFSSMANKIRSKTGTATTYTPPQMVADGIDDVFDAGVASATTSITPSDSSPVAMSANTGYKPTTNGYAIASEPTSLTPSNSSPATISSGTIYKAGGNGKAIESFSIATPSNDSPPTLTNGNIYKISMTGGSECELIKAHALITPSNSSPVSLNTSGVYKVSAAGKAVSSITDITPSSTAVSVSADDIVHIGGSGVIVDSVPTSIDVMNPDVVYQDNTGTASKGTISIAVDKKPRYIIWAYWLRTTSYGGWICVVDVTNGTAKRMGYSSGTSLSWGDWSGYNLWITSVTTTSVSFSYNQGANCRVQILIYY